MFDILGMRIDVQNSQSSNLDNDLMSLVIDLRKQAKANKDYTTADYIRDCLTKMGIQLKDTKDGVEWSINK